MNGGTVIPLPSRPVADAVPFTVRDCRATVAAYTSFLPARAHIPEPDPSETVAAGAAVIDTERDTLYGNGVKHSPTFSPADVGRKALRGDSVATSAVTQRTEARIGQERAVLPQKPGTAAGVALSASHHMGDPGESLRLHRLSRWQEQR